MFSFPVEWSNALIGGVLIGISATLLLVDLQRIAGISGIFNLALFSKGGESRWRRFFIIGLVASGFLGGMIHPEWFESSWNASHGVLLIAGLLVGFGTQLGNGCTSGHGVCGMSRLSKRSIVATLSFILSGVLTVYIANLLSGGRQ